jgi:hypothetical protein
MGGVVEQVLNTASNVVGGVLGGASDIVGGVADTVLEHPVEAAALVAGGYYFAPEIGAWFNPTTDTLVYGAESGIPAGSTVPANLTSTVTPGTLGSGTFTVPGDLGTEFVTQGGLNPAANVGQITNAALPGATLSPGAIAGAGAAGAGLLGAATDAAGTILPAAAAGTAAAGMTAAEAAGAGGAANNLLAGAGGAAAASGLGDMLVPGAILGSSLIGANAASSAANTQAAATDRANQVALDIFNQQKALQTPYREAGITAQNRLMDLLGLSGNTTAEGYGSANKPFTYSDLTASPDYQFRLGEGLKALDRQAAMRGGLISGGAVKAAQTYGQDQASQEYQNAFNRYQTNRTNMLQPLGNLVTSGQNAAANTGAAAGTYGQTAGSNITSGAAAQAAGNVGTANAITGGVGQYLNYNTNNNLLNVLAQQRQSAYTG